MAVRVLAAYPIAVSLLLLWSILPPSTGLLALATMMAAHLTLGAIVLVPVLWAARSRSLGVAMIVLVVAAALRLGPEWVSLPAATNPIANEIVVMTWNLERGAQPDGSIPRVLLESPATLVGLQELSVEQAAELEGDAEIRRRFPYRVLRGSSDLLGLGILSTLPIDGAVETSSPATLQVDLLAGEDLIAVVLAHPLPPAITTVSSIRMVVGFETERRDADLLRLRERTSAILADGRDVILFGDFNVSPLEHGFAILTEGLRDAHAEAGWGPGWTWRPSRLEWLPLGLLRIDLVLTSPGLSPRSTDIACEAGDHCRLVAVVGY